VKPLAAPLGMRESAWGYIALLNRALKANFAYKGSTLIGLFTAALTYAITLLVWRHVYAQKNGTLSISADQMFAYLALAFCLNYALTINIDQRVGQRIRLGLIATDLLKPLDFQMSQAMQSLSDCLFNGLIGTLVFATAYCFLGNSLLPHSLGSFLFFIPSLILGFWIQYSVVFLFIQGAFYTYSGYGIFSSRIALHQTFSGLQAPLTLYPPVLRSVGNWLPFQHIIYTPIALYMGQARGLEAWRLLGWQALWAAGLYWAGQWVMKKALSQLEIQGG
jgi:ABC-2 type transport system permease protein